MKTKLSRLEMILLGAPFVVLAIYWRDLPARVPLHWNLRGEIDLWGSKIPGLFIVPLSALGATVLLRFLPAIDPKLQRTPGQDGRMPTVLPIIRLALLALCNAIFALQIAVSLGWEVAGGRIMMTCLLVFFVILGNFLGNLRPNYFAGIRTPWTLENPATWRATHRLGGRLMFFGGLLLLLVQFFLSAEVFGRLFAGAILSLVIWVIFYSWHHARLHAPTRSI